MITAKEAAEADQYVRNIRHPGYRIVCSYCGAQLPGSDPQGVNISHGMCRPLCQAAKDYGWHDPAGTKPAGPLPAERRPSAPRRYRLELGGHPLRLEPIAADTRCMFQIVRPEEATAFEDADSAHRAARLYRLRVGQYFVRPVDAA